MNLITKYFIVIFVLCGMCLFSGNMLSKAFAITYNLGPIVVTVPPGFSIYHSKDIDSATGFNIYNEYDKFIGFVYQSHNDDINPTKFQKYMHNLDKVFNDFSIIHYACNDGTLSINTDYCIVSYSYDHRGVDVSAVDLFTQLPDEDLLHWIFSAPTPAFNKESDTYFNIVDSMSLNTDTLDSGSTNGFGDDSGSDIDSGTNNGDTLNDRTKGNI